MIKCVLTTFIAFGSLSAAHATAVSPASVQMEVAGGVSVQQVQYYDRYGYNRMAMGITVIVAAIAADRDTRVMAAVPATATKVTPVAEATAGVMGATATHATD
jgi:hypothetical protein